MKQTRFLQRHGVALFSYETLDSTNSEAKRKCLSGECGCGLFVAHRQTSGRGRQGRAFSSPKGGLYFSLLYPAKGNLGNSVTVTSAAAVAVRRAVKRVTGIELGIKWVNDLLLDGKKVCGILTEGITGENPHLIVGIGINLKSDALPLELSSIARGLDCDVDSAALIFSICEELIAFLEDPTDRSWLSDYRAASVVLGRRVTRIEEGRVRSGAAVAIDNDGALELRFDDGTREMLRTGEISLSIANL